MVFTNEPQIKLILALYENIFPLSACISKKSITFAPLFRVIADRKKSSLVMLRAK